MRDRGGSRAPRGFAAGPVGTSLPQVPRRRPGVISSSLCAGPHDGGGGRLRPWRGRGQQVLKGSKVSEGKEGCPGVVAAEGARVRPLLSPRAGFSPGLRVPCWFCGGFGCRAVGKAGRKAGDKQLRAGRVANKSSPLRPAREKGVKKLKGCEISAKWYTRIGGDI